MEKLEHYLDQVCRSVGGPKAMREHVRQELKEHLLDAIARHKAAGMADAAALEKALEEFGQPDEVRSELEAAHPQRKMLAMVLDKALDWKEKTMRAKWLWTTWAYLSLVLVIALESLFLTFLIVMIIPRFKKMLMDGYIDQGVLEDAETQWMVNFLYDVSFVFGNHTIFFLIIPAIFWGLFEWQVRSENKTFMRLSALGTVAVALLTVVALTASLLVILFCLGMPAMGRMARPWAEERVRSIDMSMQALEEALAKKDWPAMQEHAQETAAAANLLTHGPAATSLAPPNDQEKAELLRSHARGLRRSVAEIQKAIREHDAGGLAKELEEFRKTLAPLREAAKRPIS